MLVGYGWNEVRKLSLWQPGCADSIKKSIPIFVNPVSRKNSRDVLMIEFRYNFQNRLYCFSGVVEPVQLDVRAGQMRIGRRKLRGPLDRPVKTGNRLTILTQ